MEKDWQMIPMGFDEQVALITGGTAGIGEATVRLVASLGARVAFVGRDRLKGEQLVTKAPTCVVVSIDRLATWESARECFFDQDITKPGQKRKIAEASGNPRGVHHPATLLLDSASKFPVWLSIPKAKLSLSERSSA